MNRVVNIYMFAYIARWLPTSRRMIAALEIPHPTVLKPVTNRTIETSKSILPVSREKMIKYETDNFSTY